MAKFSIFGASGFVGRHLCDYLARLGHDVAPISRGNFPVKHANVGHAIYCIGLTADFRTKLVETVRAHVSLLADVVESYRFESLLYLSSTRVYMGLDAADEDVSLLVRPTDADHVYNLSKLTGEAICLSQGFRVARLSNVLGPRDGSENFISSLLRDAEKSGRVVFNTSPQSAKDYIDIDDACRLLAEIALRGKRQLYNVASGAAIDNDTIARLLVEHTRADVSFAPNAPNVSFPPIDVSRVKSEFGSTPTPFEVTFAKVATQVRVST
jgi:nucleoside-diphosphate-sugar epimerase